MSECFVGTDNRLVIARRRILPHFWTGKGLNHFSHSRHGYRLPALHEFELLQKTRALTATRGPLPLGPLPHPDFEVVRLEPLEPEQDHSYTFYSLVDALMKAPPGTLTATDGGFDLRWCRGSIGVCVDEQAFGFRIQGDVHSSTQAEVVGLLTLSAANKMAKTLATTRPDHPNFCDSKNALRMVESYRSWDPVVSSLKMWLPPSTWAKGHSTNEHINRADRAASEALQGRHNAISVRALLCTLGVERVCVHKPTGTVQLDDTISFVKTMCRAKEDRSLISKLLEQAPVEALAKKVRYSLSHVPGAYDILQALVGRVGWQQRTSADCPVQGCGLKATADHCLSVDDLPHQLAMSRWGDAGSREVVFGTQPMLCVKDILKAYAAGSPEVLVYVGIRLIVMSINTNMKRWATWMVRALTPKLPGFAYPVLLTPDDDSDSDSSISENASMSVDDK